MARRWAVTLALGVTMRPAAPPFAREPGGAMPGLNLIDGTGASLPSEAWSGRRVALRVGGS